MKDGFDKKKRWGNSAMKGHGANSPAMMEARAGFAKSKALGSKIAKTKGFTKDTISKNKPDLTQ